jgi:DNA transformation protein and related proteins
MASDGFTEFVLDQLGALDGVSARSMFGGHGLYCRGDFFAIAYKDRLYFRTDERSRARYEEHGSEPFQPNPRQRLKTYHEVPADVVEDRERLVEWAEEALSSEREAGRGRPATARGRG